MTELHPARRRLRTLVQQGKPLHIVIAGGGITGIEALGEILRRYRVVPGLSVDVIEPGARLLPGLPPVLDADLRRLCRPHAVRLRTGTGIAAVSAKGVRLADGARFLARAPLRPYVPSGKPVLIAFGDLDTYLVAGRTVIASQALAGAKEGVYQLPRAAGAEQAEVQRVGPLHRALGG